MAGIAHRLAAVLDTLSARRPLFHSEADFQHELAWELRGSGVAAAVRLERPFALPPPGGRIRLDIDARTAEGRLALELKDWTRRFDEPVRGERFSLRDQDARDLSRYEFWKDVARLERLVEAGLADLGAAVALTNDPAFWRKGRQGTADAAFRLHEGRVVEGCLAWSERPGPGFRRRREPSIDLRGAYRLRWRDYSEPAPGIAFRALVLVVPRR